MKRYAFAKSLIAVVLLGVACLTIGFTQVAPTTPAGVNTPAIPFVSTDPTGACTMNNLGNAPTFITQNVTTGVISRCIGGTWVQSAAILTGSAYTNATTTLSNVTGLAFPIAANANVSVRCQLIWQGSATTTGPKWAFTGPSSPTAVNLGALSMVTASTFSAGVSTAFGTAVANAGTITATTNFMDIVTLQVLNGTTAGTLQLQAAANGVGTLTVQPGSGCQFQ